MRPGFLPAQPRFRSWQHLLRSSFREHPSLLLGQHFPFRLALPPATRPGDAGIDTGWGISIVPISPVPAGTKLASAKMHDPVAQELGAFA